MIHRLIVKPRQIKVENLIPTRLDQLLLLVCMGIGSLIISQQSPLNLNLKFYFFTNRWFLVFQITRFHRHANIYAYDAVLVLIVCSSFRGGASERLAERPLLRRSARQRRALRSSPVREQRLLGLIGARTRTSIGRTRANISDEFSPMEENKERRERSKFNRACRNPLIIISTSSIRAPIEQVSLSLSLTILEFQ